MKTDASPVSPEIRCCWLVQCVIVLAWVNDLVLIGVAGLMLAAGVGLGIGRRIKFALRSIRWIVLSVGFVSLAFTPGAPLIASLPWLSAAGVAQALHHSVLMVDLMLCVAVLLAGISVEQFAMMARRWRAQPLLARMNFNVGRCVVLGVVVDTCERFLMRLLLAMDALSEAGAVSMSRTLASRIPENRTPENHSKPVPASGGTKRDLKSDIRGDIKSDIKHELHGLDARAGLRSDPIGWLTEQCLRIEQYTANGPALDMTIPVNDELLAPQYGPHSRIGWYALVCLPLWILLAAQILTAPYAQRMQAEFSADPVLSSHLGAGDLRMADAGDWVALHSACCGGWEI